MALTSLSLSSRLLTKTPFPRSPPSNAAMAQSFSSQLTPSSPPSSKIIDSHLHVWASPQQAAEGYPYFPGQEPAIAGDVDLLLKCMKEAGVDGALIVQPINHMFDHSFVTSVLKRYPSKFVGCCLANPAEEGSGINQLEHLVLKDGYRAVRFNPYLWPPGQKMTNAIGKAMFSKAGELGVPVGIMCMKVIVKLSALFRISRNQFPYEDTYKLLSQVVSVFGAKRLMWGSDFPFVVSECGYQEAKEPIYQMHLSSTDLEWIMGRTAMQLFQHSWTEV